MSFFFIKKQQLVYVAIVAFGAVLASVVHIKSDSDYNNALERYKKISQQDAEQAAKNISYSLKQVYQGLRTISFLPGVKTIDRHGTNLDDNAHESIVQVYNNMASNVAVSEIYIVPVDLEPQKIDPVTGELQTPILMYDGNIVDPNQPEEKAPPITTVEQAKHVEEVEIYEYELLKEHMTYLKQNYPSNAHINNLNLPFISGSEVLTCDNTDFEKTQKDEDRTGVMMSVPFYDTHGALKGTVTAVIRNNVLKGMIPASNAALLNKNYHYTLTAKEPGQEQLSEESVAKSEPDPDLLFSTVIAVETTDPRSEWSLWIGYPDSKFLESGDAKAVKNFKLAGYGFSGLFTAVGILVWSVLQRNARLVKQKIMELEQDVSLRISENERLATEQEKQKAAAEAQKREAMQEMAENFEFSVKGVVSQVASSTSQMQSGAENVTKIAVDTKQRSTSVATLSNEAAQTSSHVASAAEELTASIKEISTQTQKSSQIASEASSIAQDAQQHIKSLAEKSEQVSRIIDVISSIAQQINLLALNATIESARAGEAGKGFAVVAGEVKNLATQVSKAAEEITSQISDMQGATASSVTSVMKIIGIITQVSDSTTTVAAAVEEQSSVTNDIARNIIKTSQSTQEILSNIISVEEGAEKTNTTAQNVLESAKHLSHQSDLLKQKVDEFLNTIRNG